MTKNSLYYGDNLDILQRYIKDESVDLVYLDPPFKSNQNYNVLYREQNGSGSTAQVKAFEDTWRWDHDTALEYMRIVEAGGKASEVMQALESILGRNDMLAYLTMMAPRLIELRRTLKPTGSIYLHCDPTASHYIKILLDAVFGNDKFRTEISWKRSSAHSDAKQGRKQYGNIRDIIFFYTKTDTWTWNWLYTHYDQAYIDSYYKHIEKETGMRYQLDNLTGPGGGAKGNPMYEVMGITRHWRYSEENMKKLIAEGRIVQTNPGTVPRYKRYLDEMPGVPLQNDWTDIAPSCGNESLGYPTQKPTALLKRIILASSNKGDTILDPFCGCGTAIAAAQELERSWIGIDITCLAISLIKHRLRDAYGNRVIYDVIGEPVSLTEAEALSRDDRYQFQWWALGLVGARPVEQKKGADRGIDGKIFFHDNTGKAGLIILSVKSGHITLADIRDLRGVIEREKAEIGAFLTLEKPTKSMHEEAANAGFYKSREVAGAIKHHPRIQILTIEEILNGKQISCPPLGLFSTTFKNGQKANV